MTARKVSQKENEMMLIKLAARHVNRHHPEKCKDFRVLSREPLFRGMCYGVEQFGITSEEIEREICDVVLKMPRIKRPGSTEAQHEPKPATRTHFDGLYSQMVKLTPEEIARLPQSEKAKVLDMWITHQLGICKGMQMKFYGMYSRTVGTLNEKIINKGEE